MENDSMQPDHEADDLQNLLHDEYGAPRLDDQFSADLIARLQADAAPSATPTRTRRAPLAIGLVVAAAAVLVVAVIWISNSVSPETNHEVAHQAKTDSTPSARPDESTDILRRVTDDGVDNMSLLESRSEALVINESLVENGSLIASKPDSTSMALLSESRIAPKTNLVREAKPDFAREATEGENDSLSATQLSSLSQGEPRIRTLARRSLEESVAEAKVILVATALKSDLAPPNRPGDARENLITFRVTRVLKGKLPDKVITTRTPTDPEEFIGKEWVVLLSPRYMAGKWRYAGLYNIKLKDGVAAVGGPEDRREGNEKARPLSSKELSGTWRGEKESVKVEITFRGTDDAKWHLNTIGATSGANIGTDLKRVDDPQSGSVLLRFDYRSTSTGELGSAVLGCVERGEADTLQLTILPKATEFVKEYKPVKRIPLSKVNDKKR